MKKIAILMPYFGRLPEYLGLYLKSVAGRCFDVIFITDLDLGEHPANVHVVKMTFDEVGLLASCKLCLDVKMENPKRLCNFRPMYGRIFEDYIASYDYWGFGDCDLVYGAAFDENVRAVVEARWDVASFRKWWTSGPTTLVKNCEKCNWLYIRAENWRRVATMSEAENQLFFDEVGGIWHSDLMFGRMTIDECAKIRDSFCAVVSRSKDIQYYHEDILYEENIAGSFVEMTSDGRLLLAGKTEIPVFHFIGNKFRRYFKMFPVSYSDVGHYIIDDAGLYVSRSQIRWRKLVNICRKLKAFFESIRSNGLHHWIRRVASILPQYLKLHHNIDKTPLCPKPPSNLT